MRQALCLHKADSGDQTDMVLDLMELHLLGNRSIDQVFQLW